MTYEKAVREAEEVMDTAREIEGLVPVRAKVAKKPRIVTSVRLAPAELISISAAARARGVTISDFLRTAALAAAEGELDLDAIATLQEVRTRVNELAALIEPPAGSTPPSRGARRGR